MSKIDRFLNGVRRDPNIDNTIKDILHKYDNGSTTPGSIPIPNQAFQTATKYDGTPASIYFTKEVYEVIENLRYLARRQSVAREKDKRVDRPIDFVCFGYLDNSGDIIIDQINAPTVISVFESFNYSEEGENKFFLSHLPKGSHQTVIDKFNDFLERPVTEETQEIGNAIVALLGSTSPFSESPTRNCLTMGQVADSIISGNIAPSMNIVTGAISITQDTFRRIPGSAKLARVPGSLECLIASEYTYNNTTGFASPIKLHNVTSCYHMTGDTKVAPVQISQSDQSDALIGITPCYYPKSHNMSK